MFRSSLELRAHASGGPPPTVSGPHAEVVQAIVEALQGDRGVDIPHLGHMAIVPVPGKKPRLIFHGAKELNDALAAPEHSAVVGWKMHGHD